MIAARSIRPRRGDDCSVQSGFTLVELLVAIVLLGFIALLAFGGLRIAFAAWRVTDRDASDPQSVQYLLRSWIAAAEPAPLLSADGGQPVAFQGDPESLSFVTRLPDRFGVPGLYRVSLVLSRRAEQNSLRLHWSLFKPDSSFESWQADETAPDAQATLVENIGRVRFRYFGRLADDQDAAWHDSWDEQPGLPQLLMMEMSFRPEDGRRWPTLLVAPRLDSVGAGGGRRTTASAVSKAPGRQGREACRSLEACG